MGTDGVEIGRILLNAKILATSTAVVQSQAALIFHHPSIYRIDSTEVPRRRASRLVYRHEGAFGFSFVRAFKMLRREILQGPSQQVPVGFG